MKAKEAVQRLADHATPFVRNEWYVAALSTEVGSAMMDRKILGVGVLLYRRLDGGIAAMRNRCPHRSFPLSHGRLDGETVVCGYHGIAFGPDGRCLAVPSQDKVSANLDNKVYPVIERPPFIWIWMGDPARADPAYIPQHSWLTAPDHAALSGYMHCRTNYVRLHENVLDLTHFPYVHGEALGDQAFIAAPFEIKRSDTTVAITRELKGAVVNPLSGRIIGNSGHLCDRKSEGWFLTPGFHIAHASIVDLEGGVGGQTEFGLKVIHCFTPESAHSTHYFFANARDYRIDDQALTIAFEETTRATFLQDEEALELVERTWVDEDDAGYEERSVRGDIASLHMRRIIAMRAAAETRSNRD